MVICRNERVGTWSQSKNRDELTFGIFQRIIDVAGLGVFVAGAGDIVHPNIFGKLTKRFPSAVVEDPDVQLVIGQSMPCEA